MSISMKDIRTQGYDVTNLIRAAIAALPLVKDTEIRNHLSVAIDTLKDSGSVSWSIGDITGYHFDDITSARTLGMTDDEARDILDTMIDRHDATIGITYDTISYHVNEWWRENSLFKLYDLWDQLGDVPTVPEGDDVDTLEEDFLGVFPKGTHREVVWHWFERMDSKFLVGEVMNGIRYIAYVIFSESQYQANNGEGYWNENGKGGWTSLEHCTVYDHKGKKGVINLPSGIDAIWIRAPRF